MSNYDDDYDCDTDHSDIENDWESHQASMFATLFKFSSKTKTNKEIIIDDDTDVDEEINNKPMIEITPVNISVIDVNPKSFEVNREESIQQSIDDLFNEVKQSMVKQHDLIDLINEHILPFMHNPMEEIVFDIKIKQVEDYTQKNVNYKELKNVIHELITKSIKSKLEEFTQNGFEFPMASECYDEKNINMFISISDGTCTVSFKNRVHYLISRHCVRQMDSYIEIIKKNYRAKNYEFSIPFGLFLSKKLDPKIVEKYLMPMLIRNLRIHNRDHYTYIPEYVAEQLEVYRDYKHNIRIKFDFLYYKFFQACFTSIIIS